MPFTMPKSRRALGGGASSPTPDGPSSGAGSGGAAPSGGASAAPGYVNFSRILDANRPGAQRMADQLTYQVQQQGQAASQALEGARTSFQGQVQAGTLNYQQPQFQRSTAPASADLYRVAGQAAAQARRGYEGPKDWRAAGHNTEQLATQAANAQGAAQNLGTAGGRAALLRERAGPGYGAGMASLDSALAGAALGNAPQELAQQYGALSQRLVDYQRQGEADVQAATNTSNAAAQRYGTDAANYQTMGEQSQATEEAAQRYQEEMARRYPHLRNNPSIDPRIRHLVPGLYG